VRVPLAYRQRRTAVLIRGGGRHRTNSPRRLVLGGIAPHYDSMLRSIVVGGASDLVVKYAGCWLPLVLTLSACGTDRDRTEPQRLVALQGMVEETRREFPDVEGIGVDEVRRLHETGQAVFIDARSPAERAISTLPGAITPEEFERSPELYSDRTAIAYCTIGYRSAELARRLSTDGHRVLNFEGSIVAWTHAAGALDGPDGPTRRVHVYADRWNLVADGYEAVW